MTSEREQRIREAFKEYNSLAPEAIALVFETLDTVRQEHERLSRQVKIAVEALEELREDYSRAIALIAELRLKEEAANGM